MLRGHLEKGARLLVLLAHDAVERGGLQLVVLGQVVVDRPLDGVDAELGAAYASPMSPKRRAVRL